MNRLMHQIEDKMIRVAKSLPDATLFECVFRDRIAVVLESVVPRHAGDVLGQPLVRYVPGAVVRDPGVEQVGFSLDPIILLLNFFAYGRSSFTGTTSYEPPRRWRAAIDLDHTLGWLGWDAAVDLVDSTDEFDLGFRTATVFEKANGQSLGRAGFSTGARAPHGYSGPTVRSVCGYHRLGAVALHFHLHVDRTFLRFLSSLHFHQLRQHAETQKVEVS